MWAVHSAAGGSRALCYTTGRPVAWTRHMAGLRERIKGDPGDQTGRTGDDEDDYTE